MSRDAVLLLTHSGDFYVPERVSEALARRGARPIRINTDQYPTALDLRLSLSAGEASVGIGAVSSGEIRAAWLRRLYAPALPDAVPAEAQGFVRGEAREHWAGALDLLAALGVRLVNDPHAVSRVERHKPAQLLAASAAGLRTPETLVTNDPDAARGFYARCGGDVVVKMLSALQQSMGRGLRVPTRRLSEADLEGLDELRFGPMCFQERIAARAELRVAYVDGRLFAGKQRCDAGAVDWREHGQPWQPGTVDDDTAHALDRLMRRLGLLYGGIDLMVPEDGGPAVFLEVNASGEWGMLQRYLDLPIADAIAETLLKESA